jgi:transcriptional regulator with XRE-family HTH domain
LPVNKPNSRISLVGQALKDYRKLHDITQEQLAEDLGIDPRTLRLWENERPPESVRELRRISDMLGIEPERFGLVALLYIPRKPEEIEAIIQHIWDLMDEVRISEALTIIEHLLQDLRQQITTEDLRLLHCFALALQVAGYVNSMYARTSEVPVAINRYHEMEEIARIIDDPTMLNIALSYQGDMYRRQGDIHKAITYLEAARDTTPEADAAARGNGLQLLGRVSLLNKDMKTFEYTMAEADELASTIDPSKNSIHGHFNLGLVYEEYAKSYAALGQVQKALDYVKRTKASLPRTPNNRILLMIVRAEALIYGGEIESGEPLAIEAARISRIQGHHRRLERLQNIKRYLHQQSLKLAKAELELDEALEGPIEQWISIHS